MAKRSRLRLTMADGAEVRNPDELREHFDLKTVLEYYKSGALLMWLQSRYFDDEAAAVEELDEQAPDFQQKLCGIFSVVYTGEAVDLEEISRRKERLDRLRAFTDEAEFIDHVDQVAFDQEDLADLLDEEETTIYLCGEKFTVPASRKGVKYVGVNSPSVHISGKLPEEGGELGIEFGNCNVDNLTVPDKTSSIDTPAQTPFATGFCADKVTGDFIDEINYGKTMFSFLGAIQETDHYIVYVRRAYKDNEGYEPMILFDKRTGQKMRFPKSFQKFATGLADGDRVFYFEQDKYKNCRWQGDIWTIDLAEVTLPQKLFPLSWDEKNISACNGHIAYVDQDIGPAVYDLESKAISKIPVKEGECRAIYAVADGVYFSVDNHSTYTMNFYDYVSKKSKVVFEAKDSIQKIFHVENGSFFYLQLSRACVKIDLSAINERQQAEATTSYDVMNIEHSYHGLLGNPASIYAYHDYLVYVAKSGIIKAVDFRTSEIKEIAPDAFEHHYDSGGLFKESKSWNTPVRFDRIGNWIIYPFNGDYGKKCRVSLERPGEIEFISKSQTDVYDFEKEMQFLRATYDIPEISFT